MLLFFYLYFWLSFSFSRLKIWDKNLFQIFEVLESLGPCFLCAFINSYQLMRRCWADSPDARPSFAELCQDLEDWMQREVPYLDIDQLDENQPYYDASAISLSSGSSCEGHAPADSPASNIDADNFALDRNQVISEFTSFWREIIKSTHISSHIETQTNQVSWKYTLA